MLLLAMSLDSPVLIPFLVPIGLVVVMVAVQLVLLLVTGLGFDFDFDHDHDIDGDLDIVDTDGITLTKFLSPIGVGHVPLSIIWYAYGLSFGVIGIVTTFVLNKFFPVTWLYLLGSVPIGIILGWHFTKHVIRFIAPLFKTSGNAEDLYDLIGRSARVTSLEANSSFGEIAIQINGAVNHMIVKTNGETLQQGAEVVVTDIDRESKRPIVSSAA